MHIQADRALIPAHTPAVCHLTITITAPGRPPRAAERPPVNVALVLDRSGSMDGRKIEMARTAVARAIRLLDPRDHLAVVVYDDQVETLLATVPASKRAKDAALEHLARIDARGSTDLAGGWFAGAVQLGSAHIEESTAASVRRVLLLTDGRANQGIVDHDALAAAAARLRAQGISTSTLGIGADFDEQLLARIATEGGGHFYFIEKATQIPDFLASELGESLEIVARDVVVDLTCSSGVAATVLNGFATDTSAGRVRVSLGDLVADQEVTLVIAVSCRPSPLETMATVDCRVTDRDHVLYQEPMRVEWRAATPTDAARQPVNQHVLVAVGRVLAERARIAALGANRRGEFDEARRIIRDIVEHLRGLAPGNQQVAAIVGDLRRDERRLGRAMRAQAAKSMHFSSYAVGLSRDPAGRARRR